MNAMTEAQRAFLEKLAALCDEYKAGFGYTRDDDGTHIYVDGVDVFNGFIDDDLVKDLREHLAKG